MVALSQGGDTDDASWAGVSGVTSLDLPATCRHLSLTVVSNVFHLRQREGDTVSQTLGLEFKHLLEVFRIKLSISLLISIGIRLISNMYSQNDE